MSTEVVSTQGYDQQVFAELKRAFRRATMFGPTFCSKLEFASMATREMCARYCEMNGHTATAARLRR